MRTSRSDPETEKTFTKAFKTFGEFPVGNIVVVFTFLSVLLACVKLLFLSKGQINVLNAVAQSLSLSTLAYSVVLPIIPTLGTGIGLTYLFGRYVVRSYDNNKTVHRYAFVYLVPVFFCMALTPMLIVLMVAGIAIFVAVTQKLPENVRRTLYGASSKRQKNPNQHDHHFSPVSLLIFFICVYILMPNNEWITLENITFTDGESTTARVLSSDVRWTTLLTFEDNLKIVQTPTLQSRIPCGGRYGIAYEPIYLLASRADVITCNY